MLELSPQNAVQVVKLCDQTLHNVRRSLPTVVASNHMPCFILGYAALLVEVGAVKILEYVSNFVEPTTLVPLRHLVKLLTARARNFSRVDPLRYQFFAPEFSC